jgi:cytoskeleton protein RodZ
MPEIGATLREARMRARIDVSEIEAQTKIRAKYLRALENEEWSLLPGGTFVKSFLRTYAQALDLDGKALVEEYRLHHERPSEAAQEPIVSSAQRARERRPGGKPSRGYIAAIAVVVVLIVLLVYGLVSEKGGSSPKSATATATATATSGQATAPAHHQAPAVHKKAHPGAATTGKTTEVSLSLKASAAVYVCLLGDDGRKLIPGIELEPGAHPVTYHAKKFTINLGNNAVTMFVDGQARTVPSSSEPIGYSITKAGGRKRLAAGTLPTCK